MTMDRPAASSATESRCPGEGWAMSSVQSTTWLATNGPSGWEVSVMLARRSATGSGTPPVTPRSAMGCSPALPAAAADCLLRLGQLLRDLAEQAHELAQ